MQFSMSLLMQIPAILIALSFHEFAHGKMASILGDPTPKAQGRLTLNPLAHLDILGTILLIYAHFGWAKPVQVNPAYFKGDPRRGMMFVGLAGPVMNLVLSYLSAVALGLLTSNLQYSSYNDYLFSFLSSMVLFNVYLAVFNLIPIPPLDGSRVIAGLVPRETAFFIDRLEAYGPVILLLAVVTGLAGRILGPLASWVLDLVTIISSWAFL